jgi:hypothetical protein
MHPTRCCRLCQQLLLPMDIRNPIVSLPCYHVVGLVVYVLTHVF